MLTTSQTVPAKTPVAMAIQTPATAAQSGTLTLPTLTEASLTAINQVEPAAAKQTEAVNASTPFTVNTVPHMNVNQDPVADDTTADNTAASTGQTGNTDADPATATTEEKAATTAEPDPAVDANTQATDVAQAQSSEALAAEPEAPTPEAVSLAIMKAYGVDELDYTEHKKLINALQLGAQNRKAAALRALTEKFASEAKAIDATERELEMQLKATRSNHALRHGGAQQSEHAVASKDKNGQRPRAGTTYKHPTKGELWKKKREQGPNKQVFVELIQAGHTWADLEHRA
jgi:hypothetical protein